MWGLVGTKDLEGEITPIDSMKDYLDWFVSHPDEGGHGGPMMLNHTNKAIGHWNKWGIGIHPETGKEAIYLEGYIHKGPSGQPFPNADKVWNMMKDGKVKGTSWGGTVMEEDIDQQGFEQNIYNSKVQPYEFSLVADYDDGIHSPAVPEATGIIYNERAKTETIKEEPKLEEKSMTDEVKTDEPVVEPFDMKKEFDAFKVEMTKFIDEKIKAGYADDQSDESKPKEKKADEEDEKKEADEPEKKDKKDDEEDDKKESDDVSVPPPEWVEDMKVIKDQLKSLKESIVSKTDKVKTPQPQIEDKVKVDDKVKAEKTKANIVSMTPNERRAFYAAELNKED